MVSARVAQRRLGILCWRVAALAVARNSAPDKPGVKAGEWRRPMETLKRRQDYLRLKTGRKWTSPAFVLQVLPQPDDAVQNPPRFGFTVSDRAIATVETTGQRRGGAVKRNRARRRLKEAARLVAPDHARRGFDYVIIGRMDALTRDFADLLADMKTAFHKVHVASAKQGAARRSPGAQPYARPTRSNEADC